MTDEPSLERYSAGGTGLPSNQKKSSKSRTCKPCLNVNVLYKSSPSMSQQSCRHFYFLRTKHFKTRAPIKNCHFSAGIWGENPTMVFIPLYLLKWAIAIAIFAPFPVQLQVRYKCKTAEEADNRTYITSFLTLATPSFSFQATSHTFLF